MPKHRNKENAGLPRGWRYYHGAYRYRVPSGLEDLWDGKKQFTLGTTLPEAYRVWAERLKTSDEMSTIAQLLDRYALKVLPGKAPKSQKVQASYIKRLRSVFGSMRLSEIKLRHAYQYVDTRKARTSACHEVSLLRHTLTMAVMWGQIDTNPLMGLNLRGVKPPPRDRYVSDEEVVEALAMSSRMKYGSVNMIQAYIRLKLLTGLRRNDMLMLRLSDLKDDGIHVQPHKTALTTSKRLIIEWSDELREAVEMAKGTRPKVLSPWLFTTRRAECYYNEKKGTANGWDSMWQRFMDRVLSETAVTERFTEHDLRAKCASDAESLERAKQLLAHADTRTTERHYRRKPERVQPLR